MLVVTLHAGESVQAGGAFELIYEGRDSAELPKVSIVTKESTSYVVVMPKDEGGCVFASSTRGGERTPVDVLFKGAIRVKETVIHINAKSRERIKCSIDSPLKITRPAQHGGSLLAG